MPKKQVAVSLRKPPPVDPDAFVREGGSEAKPSPAKAKITAPDPIVQHGSREYREMTLYLPTQVARDLSFHCMDRNCDVNGVISEAVSRFLAPVPAVEVIAGAPVQDRATIPLLSRQSLRAIWALRPWA